MNATNNEVFVSLPVQKRTKQREFCGPTLIGFLSLARERGLDVVTFLRRHGLPEELATATDCRLPIAKFREVVDALAVDLDDPYLGLNLALARKRGVHGLVEFASRSAPNLRGALEQLTRYSALINECVRYSLDERKGGAVLDHFCPGEPLVAGRHPNEYTLALLCATATNLLGRHFPVRRIWFGHPRPADISRLVEHFQTDNIDFDKGRNGMMFDLSVLEEPIADADPELHAFLEQEARKRLRAQSGTDFLSLVGTNIRSALERGRPTVEYVAELLQMSSRTLQRRLADVHTTFQEEVDKVREHLARLYLEDAQLTLVEVAYLLGYSDLSVFVRAFKRWTGQTPGDYRRAS